MTSKRSFMVGALALLAGGCGHLLGHAVAYSPPGGRFTVTPPIAPTASTSTTQTAVGPILQHTFSAAVDGNDIYVVDYADYPAYIKDAAPAKVLEGACSGFASGSVGGTVDNERTITINGSPGRDFTTSSAKGQAHARIYLVGVRLYQVIALHAGGGTYDAQDSAFLNSFKLTR